MVWVDGDGVRTRRKRKGNEENGGWTKMKEQFKEYKRGLGS